MSAHLAPCLTLIAALAQNRVIGRDNTLPWRLPEDLRRFKALTLGHPVIMGRKTWDSLGRPLPGRSNIVVSRNVDLQITGGLRADSLEQALQLAAGEAGGGEEIFIIGGADIYRQTLPLAQRLQLTEIGRDFDGDAYFPAFSSADWQEVERTPRQAEDGLPYVFVTYARRA
jgi:dihydrofolate reductase